MVETVNFRLRRQEDIVASMAGYLSGHTAFVNDFSEGSITRSLLEAIAQEMFRQNVSYAQGITQAVRSSVKQAFNQPLRQSTKAYGQYNFYRKLLPAPASLDVSFSSSNATFNGWINGTTLTVTAIASGKILTGHSISHASITSGTQITAYLTGTGGIGTYTISINQSAGTSLSPLTSINGFATQKIPDNFVISSYGTSTTNIPIGTYYWAISALYAGNIETVTTVPIKGVLTTPGTVTFTWTQVPNASGYKIYRSTSPYMLNCSYYSIGSGATVTFTDVNGTRTNSRWLGTTYIYGVSAINSTNGNTAETLGTALQIIPTANTATLTWSPVYAADTASVPTGYRIYHAFHDFTMAAPDPLIASKSAGTTGLNFGATFVGSISGTTLTVSAITTGTTIAIGQVVSGAGIVTGTTITAFISGSGGAGTYTVSFPQTIANGTAMTGTMTYYYSVCALTASAEGGLSVSASVSPDASYRKVALSWTGISGAVGYRIFRSVFSNFSTAYCYDTTDTTFIDDGTVLAGSAVNYPTVYLLNTVTSATVNGSNVSWQLTEPGIIGTAATWPLVGSAFSVQGPITIGAGTQVSVKGTSKIYSVPSIVTMSALQSSVSTLVESLTYGSIGNTPANTINNIVSTIYGIDSGTNPQAFTQGTDVETEEEWRVRFGQSIKDLARGTRYSLGVGVQTAKLYDANGFVLESVASALVLETANQVVTIYIHNGSFVQTSAALVVQAQKIIDGYTDSQGVKQPGYKPAGIPVTVQPATLQSQNVNIEVNTSPGYSLALVQTSIKSSVEQYFKDLDISDGFSVPTITSVTATSGTGTNIYQYKIVAIDATGNKSIASDSITITNAGNTLSNQLVWPISTLGPTISYYDVLRWDGAQWGLVATIPTSAPYASGSTMTYTDISQSVSSYTFTPPSLNYFQKSLLTQAVMRTPGLVSVKITIPNNLGVDQSVVVPSSGVILVLGTLTIK